MEDALGTEQLVGRSLETAGLLWHVSPLLCPSQSLVHLLQEEPLATEHDLCLHLASF